MFPQLAGNRRTGEIKFSKFPAGDDRAVRIIAGVEHLIAKPILLQAKIDDLPQITRVNITKYVAAADIGVLEKTGKPFRIATTPDDDSAALGASGRK